MFGGSSTYSAGVTGCLGFGETSKIVSFIPGAMGMEMIPNLTCAGVVFFSNWLARNNTSQLVRQNQCGSIRVLNQK